MSLSSVVELDYQRLWYSQVPFLKQQQFLFDPHGPDGCPMYQGTHGGRGSGKTGALGRKAYLLSLLNPGERGRAPVMGAIMGRSMSEVEVKILPWLWEALGDVKRETGVEWLKSHDSDSQQLRFANGSGCYLISYGDRATLERMGRGLTLAWCIADELMRCPAVSSEDVLTVMAPALRDPRARHRCFAWGSSPNGLRGIVRRHYNAYQRGDKNWFLVHTTCHDNPHLKPEDIARIKAGLSDAMWQQEGLGICLQPGHVVFHEYDEDIHVVKRAWSEHARTLIGIDWGTGHAYVCTVQVTEDGVWTVMDERKVTDTTRLRFRRVVEDFVSSVRKRCGGDVFMMACDRAVKSERNWLMNRYESECEAGVRYLSERQDQALDWGLAAISGMLQPSEGEPRLFLSASLSPTTEDAVMGMRGAFQEYVRAQFRADTGELVTSDRPSKKTNADHQLDALRYLVCCSADEELLHGGHRVPYLTEDTGAYHGSDDDEDDGPRFRPERG